MLASVQQEAAALSMQMSVEPEVLLLSFSHDLACLSLLRTAPMRDAAGGSFSISEKWVGLGSLLQEHRHGSCGAWLPLLAP